MFLSLDVVTQSHFSLYYQCDSRTDACQTAFDGIHFESQPLVHIWLLSSRFHCLDGNREDKNPVPFPFLACFTMTRGHDYTCLKLGICSGSKKPVTQQSYSASVILNKLKICAVAAKDLTAQTRHEAGGCIHLVRGM